MGNKSSTSKLLSSGDSSCSIRCNSWISRTANTKQSSLSEGRDCVPIVSMMRVADFQLDGDSCELGMSKNCCGFPRRYCVFLRNSACAACQLWRTKIALRYLQTSSSSDTRFFRLKYTLSCSGINIVSSTCRVMAFDKMVVLCSSSASRSSTYRSKDAPCVVSTLSLIRDMKSRISSSAVGDLPSYFLIKLVHA